MIYASRSERGKRPRNEDSIYTPGADSAPLVIVADGMGGHNAGERASAIAVYTASEAVKSHTGIEPEQSLKQAVREANAEVFRCANEDAAARGMGTTIVMALLFSDRFITANVGDSRLYLYDGGGIARITVDHSLVEEMVLAGYITPEEALHHPRRNIITRALGTRAEELVDIFERSWKAGDVVMLCSDGLYECVSEKDMIKILSKADDLQLACDALVESALAGGSTDNVSAVLVRNGGGAYA